MKKDTTKEELKKIAMSLIRHAMKSKIYTSIHFSRDSTPRTSDACSLVLDVLFFNDETNFSMTMYLFSDIEKNKSIQKRAIQLMKNPDKFEEFRQIRDD